MGKKKTKKSKNKPVTITETVNNSTILQNDDGLILVPAGSTKIITDEVVDENKPHGHFEGVHWVWPNGQKTHVRFIDIAIRKKKPLPKGFYEEAEKETYLTNVKHMLNKALELGLPDSVDIRNEK